MWSSVFLKPVLQSLQTSASLPKLAVCHTFIQCSFVCDPWDAE